MTTQIPNQFSDPVGFRRWQWTQCSSDRLHAAQDKARTTLEYLRRNHAIQRQNGLNPPVQQAEIERRNNAPHLAILSEIEAELASRV